MCILLYYFLIGMYVCRDVYLLVCTFIQGAIIAVSHDEAFISRVIAGERDRSNEKDDSDRASVPPSSTEDIVLGELWIMSKKQLLRFDGSFRNYKKIIMKKVLAGEEF